MRSVVGSMKSPSVVYAPEYDSTDDPGGQARAAPNSWKKFFRAGNPSRLREKDNKIKIANSLHLFTHGKWQLRGDKWDQPVELQVCRSIADTFGNDQ